MKLTLCTAVALCCLAVACALPLEQSQLDERVKNFLPHVLSLNVGKEDQDPCMIPTPEADEVAQQIRQHMQASPDESLPPVLFIPSLIGSKLYSQRKDAKVPHWYCKKSADWKMIWLDTKDLIPGFDDCWAYQMEMRWDESTNLYSDSQGVFVQPDRSFDSLMTSNTKYPGGTGEFCLYRRVLEQAGYVKNQTLFALPYDWRLGTGNLLQKEEGEFALLKLVVEGIYKQNQKPVNLVSMSMGGPYLHLFLTQYVSEDWKQQYISTFISLSGVFGGAPVATQNQLSPSQGWSTHTVPKSVTQDFLSVTRSLPSITWLQPSADVFNNTPIIKTLDDGKVYTAAELPKVFQLAGLDTLSKQIVAEHQLSFLNPPGVESHMVFGEEVDTPVTYEYPSMQGISQNEPSNVVTTPGDGTGTASTLRDVPTAWQSLQKQPIALYGLFNATHPEPLFRDDAIKITLQVIASKLKNKA